jgi:hypothetical protein
MTQSQALMAPGVAIGWGSFKFSPRPTGKRVIPQRFLEWGKDYSITFLRIAPLQVQVGCIMADPHNHGLLLVCW